MKIHFKFFIFITIIISYQTGYSKNKGLSNCGNSCYFNASLQCLSHLHEFNKRLNENLYMDDNDFDLVARLYIKLIRDLLPMNTKIEPDNPESIECSTPNIEQSHTLQTLYDKVCKKSHTQEDAPMFIALLIDKDLKKNEADVNNLIKVETVKEISGGCTHKSTRTDGPEIFLTLPIPPKIKSNPITLVDCINEYTKIEPVEDGWSCSICNKKVQATQRIKIAKIKKYLLIQLKRVISEYDKNQKKLTVSENNEPVILDKKLTFKDQEFIADKWKEELIEKPDIYNLIAIVVHEGSAFFDSKNNKVRTSGHYRAFGKDSNDDWYEYDDDQVRKTNQLKLANILNQTTEIGTPYILFYELEEPLQQKLIRLKTSLQELKVKLHTLQEKLEKLKSNL